jgi:8-oxo-dGTP pyrophosphatase MutT (NUDIX family)
MLKTQNYVICSNVFVKKDNKYLMLRRSSKKSILPSVLHPIGGKVEKNETPLDAMKRELL